MLPGHPDGICEFIVRAGEKEPDPRTAMAWAELKDGRHGHHPAQLRAKSTVGSQLRVTSTTSVSANTARGFGSALVRSGAEAHAKAPFATKTPWAVSTPPESGGLEGRRSAAFIQQRS